jgi:hypothetical protein
LETGIEIGVGKEGVISNGNDARCSQSKIVCGVFGMGPGRAPVPFRTPHKQSYAICQRKFERARIGVPGVLITDTFVFYLTERNCFWEAQVMSTKTKITTNSSSTSSVEERVKALDWEQISQELEEQGSAVLERLLNPDQCRALAELYTRDELFRSHIIMARHGFGRGEYKYFRYPLPDLITGLRTALYTRIAPIANRWNEAMSIDVRYPEKHEDFIARCHEAGQNPLSMRRKILILNINNKQCWFHMCPLF